MDQVHSTTEQHVKGKHLTYDERMIIQIRHKEGWSPNRIAAEIGCAPNTVRNELRRGTVDLYNGHVQRYKAKQGQQVYEQNRSNCCRHYDRLAKNRFITYVDRHVREDGWSLDVCQGRALQSGEFTREEVTCTKTLYNYVDLGLMETRNHHLPEKLSRRTKHHRDRENKKVLGRSIEERDPAINERAEFGHWECDLVIGQKTGDDEVLLTLAERMSREYWMIPLSSKEAASVMEAFEQIRMEYSEHFSEVFKTITTDNGSEFARLSELEELADTLVYFAHPYTSCEKGTNERHNGIIRRFIPKGKRIDSYTAEEISNIEVWCNSLPRKILGYRTPDEVFEAELDRIYQAA